MLLEIRGDEGTQLQLQRQRHGTQTWVAEAEGARGAKRVGIASREAAAGRERERSGFTPPGVHGNPEEANGKQWGRETRGQRAAARDRETGGPARPGGRKEPKAAAQAGSGEVSGQVRGASRSGVPTGCRGAPVGETRVPGAPGGEWLVTGFSTGNGSREGRCVPGATSAQRGRARHPPRQTRRRGGERRGEAATGG